MNLLTKKIHLDLINGRCLRREEKRREKEEQRREKEEYSISEREEDL